MKEEQIMDRNKVMNTYTSTGMDNNKDKDKNDGTAGNETANSTAASYSGGEEERRENRIIARVSSVGIGGNIALSAFKLAAGILGHSGAMVSDAVHSLSDVFATFIAFVGVHMSRKAPDREHPYGHDRFECVASILLGLVLIATGCAIGCACSGRAAGWGLTGVILIGSRFAFCRSSSARSASTASLLNRSISM